MSKNLLFLTGKLAEKSLHKVLAEVQSNPKTPPFKYRVHQIGVSVAALMTPDLIARRLKDGMPAFGTCAGLILLARDVPDGRPDQENFGELDLTVRRNAYGRQLDSFEADLDVPALGGERFPAVFIRAPLIERAGPSVEVLACHDGHPVLVRHDHVWAAAFHPELSGDARLHALFLEEV